MNKILITLFIALIFSACESKKDSLLSSIIELESSEKRGTVEGLKELAKLHAEYGLNYHDSISNNYLYSAGTYYYYEKDIEQSKTLLFEYISRDDSSERFRIAALNLANIHAKESKYNQADELISEILDQQLPNYQQWQNITTIYNAKIKTEPSSSDFERLALAYTAVGDFNKALHSLDEAVAKYPDDEKRANMIYRSGFIAWEYLEDEKLASKYYNQFLREYPNDDKAGEVNKILSSGMLSMTDEQVLEMLKGNSE
jgi:tetratricopeptide (TPR) repeat protein